MSKQLEFTTRGVREIQRVKGCNSCVECVNLTHIRNRVDCYACAVRNKSCLNDRKFPYDNTRCKEFVPR